MNIPVLVLGGYMILMGIVGYINSGSATSFIMSGIGLIAALLGYLAGKGPAVWWIMTVWVGVIVAMIGKMGYDRIIVDPKPILTQFIFGSTALLAVVVLIYLLVNRFRG